MRESRITAVRAESIPGCLGYGPPEQNTPMFSNPMQRLVSLFERTLRFVRKLSLYAILLTGVLAILVSMFLASLVTDKTTTILITAMGCILGTGVISLVWPRFAAEWAEKETRSRQELLQKLTSVEAEISQLMQTRVNVNSFKPIMKLGVLETDSVIRDFRREKLHEETPGRLQRGELHEFVGVLTVEFKARFGVDLEKLLFWDAGDNTLMVSGMKSEFQGFMNQKKEWNLAEVRIHKYGGTLPEDNQIAKGDSRLIQHRDQQERDLEQRINNGMQFQSLDSLIQRWAAEWIRVLLAPLGKEIVFLDETKSGSVGLLEYLADYDKRIENKVSDLKRKRSELLGYLDV